VYFDVEWDPRARIYSPQLEMDSAVWNQDQIGREQSVINQAL